MGRFVILAAIAANVAIAITKFIAAAITHSSAMLSEGIHSVVDTGDGLLILLGLHLSKRPPDENHPYGHGQEVYFWMLVVSMSIFGAGGGVSIYEGIRHVVERHALTSVAWSYGVLACAAVFEGASWWISLRSFRSVRHGRQFWEAIESSKDPTTFVIVFEDSAALAGILVAAAGITLARWLDAPWLDGAASIVIGAMLIAVAFVLGRETWSLLLGESADRALVDDIRAIALHEPAVLDAHVPRTMHFGPERVHVDLDVRVDRARSAGELVETARRIEAAVCAAHPSVRRVSLRFPEWT